MFLLATSAAFVGFVHSLAPGHWLPVVLTAKGHRWSLSRALLGALVTASGHVLISALIGAGSIYVGQHLLKGDEEELERYAALLLIAFGLAYSLFSFRRHSHCHGHEHHGPDPEGPRGRKAPFLFLFSVGFFPCIAVLPVILAASALGATSVLLTIAAFALGVVVSLGGSTAVVTLGLMKLDHPLLEHHGDVITGVAVALMGVLLYFFPV